MHKAFKYRAYPNREQEAAMESLLHTHRILYNNALDERKTAFEHGLHVTYCEQSRRLTQYRKVNPWLANANRKACARTLQRLDRSFAAFFRRVKAGEKPGYPRFKGRNRFDSIEFEVDNGARLVAGTHAYFQYIGEVRLKMHRPIEGKVKTITYRRQADGWYVILVCDLGEIILPTSTAPTVGIDLGLKAFLVTSDEVSVKPPQHYRKAQKKLRRAARSVSRKKKGGANRRKSVRLLAKQHQHIGDQRKDFHHKTALDLTRQYGAIVHEMMNMSGLCKSKLAKSIHDAGWVQFLTILGHKAESAGVRLIAVDPRGTTQTCSQCGGLPAISLTLKERWYTCAHCGYSADRDVNAAKTILKRGQIGPPGVNQGECSMDGLGSSAGVRVCGN